MLAAIEHHLVGKTVRPADQILGKAIGPRRHMPAVKVDGVARHPETTVVVREVVVVADQHSACQLRPDPSGLPGDLLAVRAKPDLDGRPENRRRRAGRDVLVGVAPDGRVAELRVEFDRSFDGFDLEERRLIVDEPAVGVWMVEQRARRRVWFRPAVEVPPATAWCADSGR